jgi:hypothetical protein
MCSVVNRIRGPLRRFRRAILSFRTHPNGPSPRNHPYRTCGRQGTEPRTPCPPCAPSPDPRFCSRRRRHLLRFRTTAAASMLPFTGARSAASYLAIPITVSSLLHPQLRPRLALGASISGGHGGLGSVLTGTRSRAWQPKEEEGLVASCCPRARRALLVERTGPCDETIQVKESLIEESNVQLENSPVTMCSDILS